MVKIRGQVFEIALCLRDPERRISDMARLLFGELSKRSQNPIYNLLPEIVSELSDRGLCPDDFRAIMGFLLAFIKKERQNEMLTDKFCQRFVKCKTDAQAADIAYCLSVLKLNEKSFKIMADNIGVRVFLLCTRACILCTHTTIVFHIQALQELSPQ